MAALLSPKLPLAHLFQINVLLCPKQQPPLGWKCGLSFWCACKPPSFGLHLSWVYGVGWPWLWEIVWSHRRMTLYSLFQHKLGLVDEEKGHIQKFLNTCGYPNWAFQKAKKTKDLQLGNSVQSSTATNSTQVTIPYGTSERIKKNFKSYDISTSFKPINTLRGKLVHVKDKQAKDKQSNVVYGLTCAEKDCQESYVGETKQSLRARVNQHRRPSSSEAQNSAVYMHIKNSDHIFNPEEVVVLDKEERWFERGVREAIWERVEQSSLNKKGGLRFLLSHAWDWALKDIPRRLSHDQSTGSQTWWSPEVPDATSYHLKCKSSIRFIFKITYCYNWMNNLHQDIYYCHPERLSLLDGYIPSSNQKDKLFWLESLAWWYHIMLLSKQHVECHDFSVSGSRKPLIWHWQDCWQDLIVSIIQKGSHHCWMLLFLWPISRTHCF